MNKKNEIMLENISWSAYLVFVALSLFVYYVFAVFFYYRNDLFQTVIRKWSVSNDSPGFQMASGKSELVESNHENYQPRAGDIGSSQVIQSFTDEVRAYLEEAGNKKLPKEILLPCLAVIAGKYPTLAKSEIRNSLDEFLIQKMEMNCAMFLSEKEVRQIWSET